MIWWSKPTQDYLTIFSVRTEKKKLIGKNFVICNNNWWMTFYGWNLLDIQKITKQLVRLISAIICFSVRISPRKRKERWYVWYDPFTSYLPFLNVHCKMNCSLDSIYLVFQINRVKKEANVGKGITFDAFKCFYNVLFGGADLERAMFFLDTEKNGINRLIPKN